MEFEPSRCLPSSLSGKQTFPAVFYMRHLAPFPSCRTPVRFISDTNPDQTGHRSGPNRTLIRSHRKTVRYQPGLLSDINRNAVRFESDCCPTSIGLGVRFAPEYACATGQCQDARVRPGNPRRPADPVQNPKDGSLAAGRPGFVPCAGPGGMAKANQARVGWWDSIRAP
jgi:hypothetical protein